MCLFFFPIYTLKKPLLIQIKATLPFSNQKNPEICDQIHYRILEDKSFKHIVKETEYIRYITTYKK